MAPRSAPTTTTPCSSMPGLQCRRTCPHTENCLMRKLLFVHAAALAVTLAAPAIAADLPMKSEVPHVAPPFSWTSCYAGGHLGGGFARKDITDPVQLVQDSFLGTGSTIGTTTAST